MSKDVLAQFGMGRIMKHQGKLIFYHAFLETGLNKILLKPSTLDEITGKSNIRNKELLESFLDLGCSLNEISCKKGKYSLKGLMARALVDNVPMMELVRETVQYHADVALRANMYLFENIKGDYLKEFGGVIAESSRIMEPLIRGFIYHVVKKSTPLTILELGCGAGEYLQYYVDINRENSGIAIDIDASAVEIARNKLKENSIENNFIVQQDDIIALKTIGDRTFDLVTSYSNLHYFSSDNRIEQFKEAYRRLNDKGRFMLATGFKSKSLSSAYYNMLFSATQGLYPLPVEDDVVGALEKCGFRSVRTTSLLGRSFTGIVAYK